MLLVRAEAADIIQIARQVYDLWSAGLRKDFHRYLLSSACYQSWSKRHNYRLVYKQQGTVLVSCKIVHLTMQAKGEQYKVLGLGAIYTQPLHRGKGLANQLIKSVIELARQQHFSGLFLFSDIDKEFYASSGFVSLGNLDCEIKPSIYSYSNQPLATDWQDDSSLARIDIEIKSAELLCQQDLAQTLSDNAAAKFHFSSLSPWLSSTEIDELLLCHTHWLSRQPYGIRRSRHYFVFQMARNIYISAYSRQNRAKPCLILIRQNHVLIGYALVEPAHGVMRVLEIIGNNAARAYLWHVLVKQTQLMGLKRICGFEAIARDFVPQALLDDQLMALQPTIKPAAIRCWKRQWGQPMFLSLDEHLDCLPDYRPCPLLEFDYV